MKESIVILTAVLATAAAPAADAPDYSAGTVLDTRLCAEAAAEPHALDSRLLAEDWGAPVPLDTARDLGTVYRFL